MQLHLLSRLVRLRRGWIWLYFRSLTSTSSSHRFAVRIALSSSSYGNNDLFVLDQRGNIFGTFLVPERLCLNFSTPQLSKIPSPAPELNRRGDGGGISFLSLPLPLVVGPGSNANPAFELDARTLSDVTRLGDCGG